ncbi:MAG: hypothetical protein QHH24_06170 [Candidatus Bathyarchaeota archaeon]|nr:hypothetical protein [Candidatus Bathyarchaeota archaeon]
MPRKRKPEKPSGIDIFQVLTQTEKETKQRKREELLAPLNVKQYFTEGTITINKATCKGVECKLCIKACPTNALFWKAGEVGITEELCIYCGACVLNCIVDDCITVSRKRETGETERFSKPKDFTALQHAIDAQKRFKRVSEAFPTVKEYLKRRKRKKPRRESAKH